MPRRLIILLLLCIGCLIPPPATQAQGDPVSEVIRLINHTRASYGLPAYQADLVLMSVAQAQASWSAANNHIGHDGPGGSSPNDRAQAAGYGGWAKSSVTENAAHGTASYNTPEWVVTMWQSDPVHLNAIISPKYEHIGVGFAEAGGNSWYVMMAGWVADDPTLSGAQPQDAAGGNVAYTPLILSEPDETGAIHHPVQPGQSAWTIAAHYGIDLVELFALNNLTEASILQPGDVLLVRPPQPATSTPSTSPTCAIALASPASASSSSTPAPNPISSAIPTAAISVIAGSSSQLWFTPIYLLMGLGVTLLTAAAFIRAWNTRA